PIARTDDPQERSHSLVLELPDGPALQVRDDPYSDRIRCDHPRGLGNAQEAEGMGEALGEALLEAAHERGRGRVVVLGSPAVERGLRAAGFHREGLMPGFYGGEADCAVMGAYPDSDRATLANPKPVAKVRALLDQRRESSRTHAPVATRRAEVEDAPKLAALLAETFAHYPTPSGD